MAKSAKPKGVNKVLSVKVERFTVRQIAVNLVSGDAEITCPQSPDNRMTPLAALGCPDPSVCAVATVSGFGAILQMPPLAAADLTTILREFEAPRPFTNFTLTVVASKAKHALARATIKKVKG